MKIQEIIDFLHLTAPASYQESYDNSGLLVGHGAAEVNGILVTLDCTEEVVLEAIEKKCNLIIAHHPLIFKPLKRITYSGSIEKTIIKAIQHDISIFALHTNLDNVADGVNRKIAEKIGLLEPTILDPKIQTLEKLVTYVPEDMAEKVKLALFAAGGGTMGNYSQCSFTSQGTGSFLPSASASPYLGKAGVATLVPEHKIEILFPSYLEKEMVKALKAAHPYEEPAYDLIPLNNANAMVGSGMIGQLPLPMTEGDFLMYLKESLQLTLIRHTPFIHKKIKKVALCGGSGSFLLKKALQKGADVFISSDFKYHEFFEAEGKILIADINHYEGEVFTKELIYDIIRKKFTNIALVLSNVKTNPISYL